MSFITRIFGPKSPSTEASKSNLHFPQVSTSDPDHGDSLGQLFEKIDSSQLFRITPELKITKRDDFLARREWRTPPPMISMSEFVNQAIAEHLMRNKKNLALGSKYVTGDAITNMEGAMHAFVTPLCIVMMLGDYAWKQGHTCSLFGDSKVRRVILSAAVQPDFEKDNVMIALMGLEAEKVEGELLRSDFRILTPEEKKDNTLRMKYDAEIRRHMVYHLTSKHRLPSLQEALKAEISLEEAIELVEKLIETTNSDLSEIESRYLRMDGLTPRTLSLEMLFRLYVCQLLNEMSALEKLCTQGYVYTIDPPETFAKAIGGAALLNRLQILAFKYLVETDFSFENLKVLGFNDFKDKKALYLFKKVFPRIDVRSREQLFSESDGHYSSKNKYALVIHNNGDAFGHNIRYEGPSSLDGAIGSYSDAACVLSPGRGDLLLHRMTSKMDKFLDFANDEESLSEASSSSSSSLTFSGLIQQFKVLTEDLREIEAPKEPPKLSEDGLRNLITFFLQQASREFSRNLVVDFYDDQRLARILSQSVQNDEGQSAELMRALISALQTDEKNFEAALAALGKVSRPLALFFSPEGAERPVTCVILPSAYKPPLSSQSESSGAASPKIFFIDAKGDFGFAESNKVFRGVRVHQHASERQTYTYWAAYNILMLVIKGESEFLEQFKDKTSDEAFLKIAALFKNYYVTHTDAFLESVPERLIARAEEPQYLPHIHYIERYAALSANPQAVLKLYQLLYPHYAGAIAWIGNAILEILTDQDGLFRQQGLREIEKFLQIALYRDPLLKHILGEAYTQGWLNEEPYLKLNLINLAVPVALAFKNLLNDELYAQVLGFEVGKRRTYHLILKELGRALTEGMQGLDWYGEMLGKLKLARLVHIERMDVEPLSVEPSSAPTLGSSEQAKAPVRDYPPFPARAVRDLLSFASDLQIREMLEKAGRGERTALFSALESIYSFSTESPLYHILAANLTFSRIWSLTSTATSKLSFANVYNLFSKAMRGQDLKTPSREIHGEFERILNAAKQLSDYLQAFYQGTAENRYLDTEALLIRFLNDKELNEFLSDANICSSIATLLAAVQVPGITQSVVEKALQAFVKIQKIVFELPEKEKITSYSRLAFSLGCYGLTETTDLLAEMLPLVKELNTIVQIYLKPQIFCVDLLALPRIETLFTKRPEEQHYKTYKNKAFPRGNLRLVDMDQVFRIAKTKEMGNFLASPVDAFLATKVLGSYRFSSRSSSTSTTSKPASNPTKKLLEVSFRKLAFSKFSFKCARFKNFDFENTYFEDCDFSGALFSGDIKLENVYVDASTAHTLLEALKISLFRTGCTLKGKLVLINRSDKALNKILTVPECLQPYVNIEQAYWIQGFRDDRDEEDYLPVFPQVNLPSSSSSSSSHEIPPQVVNPQPQTRGYMRSLWGGLWQVADFGKEVSASLLQALLEVDTSQKVGSITTQDKAELSRSSELETSLEQLQQELEKRQRELDQKLVNVNKTLTIQKGINQTLSREQQSAKREIAEQNGQLENIAKYLALIKAERKEKQRIATERQQLLEHPCSQVRIYYKSLLTGLCSVLEAIFILQSSVQLIKPNLGIATKISGQQAKLGALTQKFKDNPHFFSGAREWLLGVARIVKDSTVEIAGCLKPLAGLLPAGGGVVQSGVTALQEFTDQEKIDKAGKAYKGLTVKTIEKIADAIARKIARAYEEQILLLSEKGAEDFAECAVVRLLGALLNGHVKNSEDFATSAWTAIRLLKFDQNQQTLLGLISIPLTSNALELKDKSLLGSFSEDVLYRQCGIAYFKHGKKYCYSNDRKLARNKRPLPDKPETYACKIGYMHVTEEEWENYFQDSVTFDEAREISRPLKTSSSSSSSSQPLMRLGPSQKQLIHTPGGSSAKPFSALSQTQLNVFENMAADIIGQNLGIRSERKEKVLTLKLNSDKRELTYEELHRILSVYLPIFEDIDFDVNGLRLKLKSSADAKLLEKFFVEIRIIDRVNNH